MDSATKFRRLFALLRPAAKRKGPDLLAYLRAKQVPSGSLTDKVRSKKMDLRRARPQRASPIRSFRIPMSLKSAPQPTETNKSGNPAITVGCLFAAIGGFAKAFQNKGSVILWANEKDRFAKETFELNHPSIRYIHKPVEDLSVRLDKLPPVDVLTAGFPCQPFSVAGEKKGFKDERGLLFLHIIRIIKEFGAAKPKVLLLENVKNFRTHDGGRTFKRVQAEIQKAGYWFGDENAKSLNTATHTIIPQNRERIFMVAYSASYFASNTFKFPDALPNKMRVTVRSLLDLNEKAEERYYFKPGSRYYPYFVEAIANGQKDSVYQLRRSYVRENKSGECFTLMANMGDGGHNQPVIKDRWGIRKLTPRECARLQGYEDSWFKIPKTISVAQISKQLGNSVTIPLVERIAETIIADLKAVRKAQAEKAS